MLKRSIQYAWSVRREFTKYFIVGVSGVVLDIGTLIAFKEWVGLTPVMAVIVNQAFLLIYNFTLNKYWSFRNRELPHRQIVRYLSLAAGNYGFSVAAMYGLNEHLGVDYRLARIATIIVAVGWNFLLYKYWVYTTVETPEIPEN